MRLFSKGVSKGLTIKTVQWPGDSVKDARICHLPDRPLHEIVSFECVFKPCLFKNVSIKKHLGAKQRAVFCYSHVSDTRELPKRANMKYVKLPLLASKFSNN